jgi:hypothetical protein
MVNVCLGGGGSYEASGYDFGEIHEVKLLDCLFFLDTEIYCVKKIFTYIEIRKNIL